ncbi:MAG: translation initiation factor IF-1 [Patescibacteria group bacterium]
MGTKEVITKEGKVIETLMSGMFKIQFADETTALAMISGKMRKQHIRVLVGDGVRVEFSPHDLTRGRVTFRLK